MQEEDPITRLEHCGGKNLRLRIVKEIIHGCDQCEDILLYARIYCTECTYYEQVSM